MSCNSVNTKSSIVENYQSCNGRGVFRSDRLEALMAEKRVTQSELARQVGVSQTTIWKLLKEPSQGSKHTHRIARVLGTTSEYLMDETEDAGGGSVGEGRTGFRAQPPAQPAPEPDPDHVEIDMLDLAYGMGGTFVDIGDDGIEAEKVRFSRSWLRQFTHAPPHLLFTTKGVGDSMWPTIGDNDVVVINRAERVVEFADKIWAVVYGGVGSIKRLRPLPDGSVELHSDNQMVRPARATDGDLHIVGRVVAVVRKV